MTEPTDREFVEAFMRAFSGGLEGEEMRTALEELFRLAPKMLKGATLMEYIEAAAHFHCRRWPGVDPQDVRQDAAVILIGRAGTIEDPMKLCAWIHGVVENLARMQSRRARRMDTKGGDLDGIGAPDQPDPSPPLKSERRREEEPPGRSIRAAILAQIRRFPRRLRSVSFRFFILGQNAVEIARDLGIKPPSVRVYLHRARVLMRAELHQAGLAPR